MRAALQGEGGMKVGFSDGARREMKVGVSDGACKGMKDWMNSGACGEMKVVSGWQGWMGLAIRAFAMLTGRARLAWGVCSGERRDVDNR